jgi:hypothetical protein
MSWKKPSYNGECVTRYDISWGETGSEQSCGTYSTKKDYSFAIESLDACVQYHISVRAVNGKDESNITAVNTTTETESKKQIVFRLSYLQTNVYEMNA